MAGSGKDRCLGSRAVMRAFGTQMYSGSEHYLCIYKILIYIYIYILHKVSYYENGRHLGFNYANAMREEFAVITNLEPHDKPSLPRTKTRNFGG